MTDTWVIAGLVVAVSTAAAGLFVAAVSWVQMRNARVRLEAERQKVARLGEMVDSLAEIAQSQKEQLAAVLIRLQMQNQALQVQQRDSVARQEGLAWQKLLALGKFAAWLYDHYR